MVKPPSFLKLVGEPTLFVDFPHGKNPLVQALRGAIGNQLLEDRSNTEAGTRTVLVVARNGGGFPGNNGET